MKKVFITGRYGMVGRAIERNLPPDVDIVGLPHSKLDLTDKHITEWFFQAEKPDYVFFAAAKVGGIYANSTYPADFIFSNINIQANVIECCHKYGAGLLFLGSACIYPKMAEVPITEESLLTGALEPTNKPYAVAKIAGITTCESYNRQYGTGFRCLMPTNLYGPSDNYHPEDSHVIPALIRRFHAAKIAGDQSVTVWGSGNAVREFLYVDDLARACGLVARAESPPFMMNVGTGSGVSIGELAGMVAGVVGYAGEIKFDTSKPDGTPVRVLDSSKIAGMGWKPIMTLEMGLAAAYKDFEETHT